MLGGFSLIAAASGPQIAVMHPAHMFTVSVQADEEVRLDDAGVRTHSQLCDIVADVASAS